MNVFKALKFMAVAEAMMGMSKDNSTKVGAVALDDDFNMLSAGYNGFPRGVNDDLPERHERPLKYSIVVHAEGNMVAQAARKGHSLMGSTVIVTSLFPCSNCAGLMAQAGVKRIITTRSDNERWVENAEISQMILDEAGVEVVEVKKNDEDEWEVVSTHNKIDEAKQMEDWFKQERTFWQKMNGHTPPNYE